jgi:hypothetical protein
MDDLRDSIDSDEGYRSVDWDCHLDAREPFFTYALPCENCGEPVEERAPASWDPDVQVGPCCQLDIARIPDVPICQELYRLTMLAGTIGEMVDIRERHRKVCRVCNPELDEMREAA